MAIACSLSPTFRVSIDSIDPNTSPLDEAIRSVVSPVSARCHLGSIQGRTGTWFQGLPPRRPQHVRRGHLFTCMLWERLGFRVGGRGTRGVRDLQMGLQEATWMAGQGGRQVGVTALHTLGGRLVFPPTGGSAEKGESL